MKKLILAFITSLSVIFIGCDKKPTPEIINSATYGIGVSSAIVANQIKTSNKERATIAEIITIINDAAPTTDQTFSAAWTPIIDKYLSELVEKGKLDITSKNNILVLVSTSIDTLEFVIYKRYPSVKVEVELSSAATHGFCKGFLAFYKLTNNEIVAISINQEEYDKEAYEYHRKLLKDLL